MKRATLVLLCLTGLVLTLSGGAWAQPAGDAMDPRARIKRAALTVPDLDAALSLFRDVLGFRVDSEGVLAPGDDAYLPLVFNLSHERPLRRALFSTATEPRGLFVLEVPEMAVPAADMPGHFALVVESSDLDGLAARARAAGFETLAPQEGQTPDGGRFREMLVIGPAHLRVLTFEYAP